MCVYGVGHTQECVALKSVLLSRVCCAYSVGHTQECLYGEGHTQECVALTV